MSLQRYKEKRDFKKTKEPPARLSRERGSRFVVQKHHASHLHYDFRLELDGVLKSWAVPKGPSLDPQTRRLAVQVEDHPVDYAGFEGAIPEHEYGGGHVIVWDRGTWKELSSTALADWKKGRLEFELRGEKLKGRWLLLRTRGAESRSWLLIKRSDEFAKPGSADQLVVDEPRSVVSGKTIEDLESGAPPVEKKTTKKAAAKPARGASVRARQPPDFVEPELATLTDKPPIGDKWIHEIKYDGYRTLCRISGKKVQLLTRTGLDWTSKYRELEAECGRLPVKTALFDGEIVATDEKGRSKFQALQNALSAGKTRQLLYYVFDLLFINGESVTHMPLADRKALLHEILAKTRSKKIIYSEHWQTSGKKMLAESCRIGLEGIISKRIDAPYSSGRNEQWLKTKCGHDQEFVIVGFTPPKGSRHGFGSLVMAVHDEPQGRLIYAGRVGTGFDEATLKTLMKRMKPLVRDESPFEKKIPLQNSVTWIEPRLVAQVSFAGLTQDGLIRHGSFSGLREDKPAADVAKDVMTASHDIEALPTSAPTKRVRKSIEKAVVPGAKPSRNKRGANADVAGVRITHPERKMFTGSNATKALDKYDVADYYSRVARPMLEFFGHRPLSLLRCPDGAGGECFFQKHLTGHFSDSIQTQKIRLQERKAESETVITVDSAPGLVSLVQMGVIEIHNWGSTSPLIERPDSLVFDLDPDTEVSWAQMVEGALAIRETLESLQLKTFLKVTGGKGLHIHVPIEPIYRWDDVKLFTKTVAANLAQQQPSLYTTNILKKKRTGKIFIDYLRNGFGATSVAPYSIRARPNAPLALPIPWKALNRKLDPAQFHLASILQDLRSSQASSRASGILAIDPWTEYGRSARKIEVLESYVKSRRRSSRIR